MTLNEKSLILQELSHAKISHMRWVKRAEHLISDLPVDKDFIPLEATTCEFGVWLYNIGSSLRLKDEFKNIIEQIEFYHDNLHDTYLLIYKIYFVVPENRSLLHKIMTFNSHNPSNSEKVIAKEHYETIKKSSYKLLNLIDRLDNMVREAS